MDNSIWYNKIQLTIEEKIENLHSKDFKFYRVDYLLALANKIDKLSVNCNECKRLKEEIETTVSKIDNLLSGSITLRKEYEHNLNKIDKHIRKAHQIYPKQYFLYLNTFIGIFAGLIIGVLLSLITDIAYLKAFIILSFTIGLFAGRIWGKIKEKKLKKEGKLL